MSYAERMMRATPSRNANRGGGLVRGEWAADARYE
jgi:hypothetical protein